MESEFISLDDNSVQLNSSFQGSENLEDDLLKGLDSYMEDINDRLTISRMVNDSLIKGMVTAVEQEAAEMLAEKEVEVVDLKAALQNCCAGADKSESIGLQVSFDESSEIALGADFSAAGYFKEYDKIERSLNSLGSMAKKQFQKLRTEIDQMKGSSSIRRSSSSTEMVGLSGILDEKKSERWVDVDKLIQALQATLDATYEQVNVVASLAKASVSEWQKEQEYQGEIEAIVMNNSIRGFQVDYKDKLWDHNARACGCQAEKLQKKFHDISSLVQEVDAICNLLFVNGNENSEDCSIKKTDHLHRMGLNSHLFSCISTLEGNVMSGASKITLPDNLEGSELKHMSKEDLFKYFKVEMTEMKRNLESFVTEVTEQIFSVKREILKERDPLSVRKDKEFDILRRKISEIGLKLGHILVDSEKSSSLGSNGESLCSLKDRLEGLIVENRQLRDLLDDKKEVKGLSSLLSDADEKLSKHSLAEASIIEEIESLRSATIDAQMEVLIVQDVDGMLKGVSDQLNYDTEQFDMESVVMQDINEIVFRGAVSDAEATFCCRVEDSEIQSRIMQGIYAVILRESFKDAEILYRTLEMKYTSDSELLASIKEKVLETERTLVMEIEERERLSEEVLLLEATIEEKEKFGQEVAITLRKEREMASQELDSLRSQVTDQQILISNTSKELDLIKSELVRAMEKIKLYEEGNKKLNQMLKLEMKQSREIDEERKVLRADIQEKRNTLALAEAIDRGNRKILESSIVVAEGLLKAVADFELRVAEAIKKDTLRLKNSRAQFDPLTQQAGALRRTGVLYKKKLERKCSDLQKAEAEVDLLGDEVEILLSLLEKIYIALDHYSPILHHYPGIMDILKLIRKELSREALKQLQNAD